jgi:PAS domain S-box-containing protein
MSLNRPQETPARSIEDTQPRALAADGFHEFEAVVENLEEMIVVVDRNYRYRMANRAYLKFRAAQREEVIGRHASEVVSPQIFNTVIKPKLDECFQNHIVKFEMTHNYSHLGERNLSISYFPIIGSEGVEGVASILEDVTDLKRAQDSIRRERDCAQRYLNVLDVILLGLDLEGHITLVNRKGCATLGREEHELLGQNWFDTCLPPETRQEVRTCFQNFLAGDTASIECPVLTKSGEERIIGWRSSLVRDDQGRVTGTLSSGEDITERKKFESVFRHLSGRLLQAQDEERRKVARELHDGIGSYIGGLSLVLGQIRTFLDDTNPQHRRAIAECRELIQAAGSEIRSIAYLLHPPMIEVMGLQGALEWLVRGFSSRSGIGISLQLAPDLGRLKPETELALFRVTQEALSNVHRHSGSSTAALRLYREAETVVLEVVDQGCGMHPRSFESVPEFTVGISGMRERVEDLGGTLTVESVAGEGCSVRAALPLHGGCVNVAKARAAGHC